MKKIVMTATVFAFVLVGACGGGGGGDRCQGVVCNTPPANVCKDSSTLIEYDAQGTCQTDTGRCSYTSQERNCPAGCQNGACQGEVQAEGFVFLSEVHSGWGDYARISAYFAEELHVRKIPGFMETRFLVEARQEGNCSLYYNSSKGFSLRLEPCMPPCGGDTYCSGTHCVPYPPHWNVGDIVFSGLQIALTLSPDEFDNYFRYDGLPADLFDKGSNIELNAPGGELIAFTMNASGVAALELASGTLSLPAGKEATISWTPADPGSRVLVFLRGGIHKPALPSASIVCDLPDEAGGVTLSAALVDGFRERASPLQQISEVMRYRQQKKSPFGGEVEFRIASVVELGLELP